MKKFILILLTMSSVLLYQNCAVEEEDLESDGSNRSNSSQSAGSFIERPDTSSEVVANQVDPDIVLSTGFIKEFECVLPANEFRAEPIHIYFGALDSAQVVIYIADDQTAFRAAWDRTKYFVYFGIMVDDRPDFDGIYLDSKFYNNQFSAQTSTGLIKVSFLDDEQNEIAATTTCRKDNSGTTFF